MTDEEYAAAVETYVAQMRAANGKNGYVFATAQTGWIKDESWTLERLRDVVDAMIVAAEDAGQAEQPPEEPW